MKLSVIVNDVTHVVLKKSKATGTVSLELRDIYVPSAFKLALINDEAKGAASCTLEMVWDTTNAAETTEVMSISWRKTETTFEFGSQITWRYSRDTDAITGKIDRTHGQLQVTLSVLHNNRRDWGLDMSSQFEYQDQVCTNSNIFVASLFVSSGHFECSMSMQKILFSRPLRECGDRHSKLCRYVNRSPISAN